MKSPKKLVPKGGADNSVTLNGGDGDHRNRGSYKLKKHDKNIRCTVRLLDDTQQSLEISISKHDLGRQIFIYVCGSVGDLAECDYFGLRYTDRHRQRQWLDLDRAVYKQLKGCRSYNLSFRLKHYPSDPIRDVKQDLTRYLIYLQIRRDLAQGRLLCPPELMSQLGALIVQAELGDAPQLSESQSANNEAEITTEAAAQDTDTAEADSHSVNHSENKLNLANQYLENFKIFPSQTSTFSNEIAREHQKLRGLTTQEAESEVLSRVSNFPTYGIEPFLVNPLHMILLPKLGSPQITESGDQNNTSAANSTNSPTSKLSILPPGIAFYLGLTSTGIVTFVGLQRNQEYDWNQIDRMACDGKQFVVHLKQNEKSPKIRLLRHRTHLLLFECESKYAALAIWHWAIDRQFFFTLKKAKDAKRVKPSSSIFRRSHTYRFSGRSHKELNSMVIDNPCSEFTRVSTLRRDGILGSASVGHATLPSRLRPPLDLKECQYNEVFENPVDQSPSSETVQPILIPDTVIEHPTEEDASTLIVQNEDIKPVSEATVFMQPVEETLVQSESIPQLRSASDLSGSCELVTSGDQVNSEIRNRINPNLIQSVVYQQVVSEFDHAVDTHSDNFSTADDVKLNAASNGFSHNNGIGSLLRNGPISQRVAGLSAKSADVNDSGYSRVETTKTTGSSGATKATTVTVVAVMVLLGLIVLMETNPNSESAIIRTLRDNAVVNNVDTYIYTPVRNAVSSGLSFLWS